MILTGYRRPRRYTAAATTARGHHSLSDSFRFVSIVPEETELRQCRVTKSKCFQKYE